MGCYTGYFPYLYNAPMNLASVAMSNSLTLGEGEGDPEPSTAVDAADAEESTDDAVEVAGDADLLPPSPPPSSRLRNRMSFLSAHFRHLRHFFFFATLRWRGWISGLGFSDSSFLFPFAFLLLLLLLRMRSILDSPQISSALAPPRPRFKNCVARLSS